MLAISTNHKFSLSQEFIKKYEDYNPFADNPIGFVLYYRSYSRLREDGTGAILGSTSGSKEKWPQTIERVVNGTYHMQKIHIESNSLGWSDEKGQKSAQEMYERMLKMKFLQIGRAHV